MNFQERNTVAFHTSNQKTAGCLDYVGDEILLSYMRIVISQYKDPSQTTSTACKINMEPTNHPWKERKLIFQTSMRTCSSS